MSVVFDNLAGRGYCLAIFNLNVNDSACVFLEHSLWDSILKSSDLLAENNYLNVLLLQCLSTYCLKCKSITWQVHYIVSSVYIQCEFLLMSYETRVIYRVSVTFEVLCFSNKLIGVWDEIVECTCTNYSYSTCN